MKQLELSNLVDNYTTSLKESNLTGQMETYRKLKEFVKSGIKIDLNSTFMASLLKSKEDLHSQILEWHKEAEESKADQKTFLHSHAESLMQKQSFPSKKPKGTTNADDITPTTSIENRFN